MPLLGTPITLRQVARVIEDSRRLRVVSSQQRDCSAIAGCCNARTGYRF